MRRWREFLEPAVVILAGVLAVVMFGVVLYSRGRAAEPARSAPPAVVPPSPPAQIPIPLPSLTPSPSFAPIDSITIERVPVPDTVDLDAEGTIDWVHWGENGRFSLERDADGGFAILEGTPSLPRNRHTASPQRFNWTGGAPLARASGVTSGVSTCGKGNGFTVSAPAGTDSSTLTVYVGATAARGDLHIELSTGKEFDSSWEVRDTSMATSAYVISYQASRTGKISVEWITGASFDAKCGGVALQAATLS
ncbi:hypothetical protein [Actinoplanes utahensis]|uniref:hypothetical protein n=1 Tax=Actinoplanes utahensis TaxID=1869 RepID=UPI000AEA32E0|nr:hypothetical protein [Actinoplanes utahensis]